MASPIPLARFANRGRFEIERIAEEYLRGRVDVPPSVPTDVELLIETPDVRLRTMSGLRTQFSVEGCVCNQFMQRTLLVYIDDSIANSTSLARYNAVVAEELAHIVLHKAVIHSIESPGDFVDVRRDPHWQELEREAHLFSLAIRMPMKLVEREANEAYEFVVREFGFEDLPVVEQKVANRLADRFAVMPSEAKQRLTQPPSEIMNRLRSSVQSRSTSLVRNWILSSSDDVRQRELDI